MKRNPGGHNRFENTVALGTTIIAFEIERAWIIEQNKMPFLEFWNISRIAQFGRLHDLFGKVRFMIGGYDHDERAIFEIPEVRKYLRELASEWPYFLYADALDNPFLCDLIKCMIPNVTIFSADSDPLNSTVRAESGDIQTAYKSLLYGMQHAFGMDNKMNQETFDSRVEAVQAEIQKQIS